MATEQTATDEALASLRTQMSKREAEVQQIAEEATTAVADANKKAADALAARLQSDKAAIQNGIAAAEASADAAEMRLAEASEAGNHAAIAKATRELNEAIATKNAYTQRKQNLETWERNQQERIRQQPPQRQTPQQQEQGRQFPPNTKAWLDKHGIDGQTDNAKFLRAQGAHFKALAEGLVADSAEYISFLDREFGGGAASAESPLSQAADTMVVDLSSPPPAQQQDQRREPPPVALAPSRPAPIVSPPSNQIVGGKVTLSPSEVEAARYSNPDLYKLDPDAAITEYARNKARLIQEGRL